MTPAFQDICKAALVPLLICVFHAAVTTSAPGHVGGHALHKRNAIQLCNLMTRYTDRYCTDYSNYGCFCGYGGIGNNPVDDVDRCCYDHDKCYAEALDSCWYYWYIFLVRYTYECVGEKCTCTDSSYWHPCAGKICQCDVQFGECLAWTRYNNAFWKYSEKGKCI